MKASSLADLLDSRRDELIEHWLEQHQTLGASRDLSRDYLALHLPDLIAAIIAALRQPPHEAPPPAVRQIAEDHGHQRVHLGVDASLVVREHALLRECILHLAEQAGAAPTLAEARVLSRILDAVAAASVAQFVRDTEHIAAERERLLGRAQEAERALSTLVRNLPGMAYRCPNKPPWPLIYASEGTTALCGYTPEDFYAQRVLWGSLVHPEDVDRVAREVEVATAANKPFTLSYRIRTKAGEERWVWDRGVGIMSHDATLESLEGFVLDVTERTRAEHQIALLAAVAEASEDFIGIAHLDGAAFFVNPAGRRLVGLESAEEVTQSRISDYLAPDSVPIAEQLVKDALERGHAAGELNFRHFRTGERIPMWWPVFVIKDATGKPFGLATVAHDLRGPKAREADERRRAEFEQQLIGIVSHDLRNPLNAILLGAQMLLRLDGLSERATKAAERIQSSAQRAARMVMDLLDFTQARLGGGIQVQRGPLELHAFVRQVLEEVQMNFPARDVRVEAEGDAAGTWDADRVAQVVTNLASNALKYSPEGTPVVVRLRGERDEVVLSVHNDGPAIPPERLSRLFEPMQRASPGKDKTGRSVGLGLYIVKSIVNAHRGSVGVESSDAEGTTFTVRLPRKSP